MSASAVVAPKRIFIVIPAFEEASRLPGLLEEIAAQGIDAEVVVVDDASKDATSMVAAQAGARVLRHPFNMGYGAALQTGYKYALQRGATAVLQLDADGQHPPSALRSLLEPVESGECDLAVGSRFLEATGYEMGALKSLGRRAFRALARLGGLDITDPTSGFQAMNRSVLELFVSDWYPVDYPDVDVLLLVHRRGLRIRELSVQMAAGWRESLLHSGWKPLYYCYRLVLSIWALSGVPPGSSQSTSAAEAASTQASPRDEAKHG